MAIIAALGTLVCADCRPGHRPLGANSGTVTATAQQLASRTAGRHLYPYAIAQAIYKLSPWPKRAEERDLTRAEWCEYVKVAHMIQGADSGDVTRALEIFTKHFEYSFDETVDKSAQWSKPLILLRLAFIVGEDPSLFDFGGGFGAAHKPALESRAEHPSDPVQWTEAGPTLIVYRGAYNGGRYLAEEEFEHFRSRCALRPSLEQYLESHCPGAVGESP